MIRSVTEKADKMLLTFNEKMSKFDKITVQATTANVVDHDEPVTASWAEAVKKNKKSRPAAKAVATSVDKTTDTKVKNVESSMINQPQRASDRKPLKKR